MSEFGNDENLLKGEGKIDEPIMPKPSVPSPTGFAPLVPGSALDDLKEALDSSEDEEELPEIESIIPPVIESEPLVLKEDTSVELEEIEERGDAPVRFGQADVASIFTRVEKEAELEGLRVVEEETEDEVSDELDGEPVAHESAEEVDSEEMTKEVSDETEAEDDSPQPFAPVVAGSVGFKAPKVKPVILNAAAVYGTVVEAESVEESENEVTILGEEFRKPMEAVAEVEDLEVEPLELEEPESAVEEGEAITAETESFEELTDEDASNNESDEGVSPEIVEAESEGEDAKEESVESEKSGEDDLADEEGESELAAEWKTEEESAYDNQEEAPEKTVLEILADEELEEIEVEDDDESDDEEESDDTEKSDVEPMDETTSRLPDAAVVAGLVAKGNETEASEMEVVDPEVERERRRELFALEKPASKWVFWRRPSKRDQQLARVSEGYLEMIDLVRAISGQLQSQTENNLILRDSLSHLPEAMKGLENFSKSQRTVGKALKEIHSQLRNSGAKDQKLLESLVGFNGSMVGFNDTLKDMDGTSKATMKTFDRVQERMRDSDIRMENLFQNIQKSEEKVSDTMVRLQRNMAIMQSIFLICLMIVIGVLVFTLMEKDDPAPAPAAPPAQQEKPVEPTG